MSNIADKEVPPQAGAYVGYNAYLVLAGETVAKIQRFSFTVDNNIAQTYVVSSRTPLNIETRFVIRGTIRRLYINTAFIRLALGKEAQDVPALGSDLSNTQIAEWMTSQVDTPLFSDNINHFRLPEFTITCQIKSKSSSNQVSHFITLTNVKFNTYDWTVNANEVILENVNFFAESATVSIQTDES
ncbi:MAG: hypothetical protein PVG65_02655 [Candidatus Thorarchaeota archaeon]|jgi:hypothetical protein